ncbi:MiaB/RimO family radical SAM methylthiotransferase, partial [archaeon]|nr:MiaB/RimO family radical SAM methylthiotransferase [archaeon]
GMRFPELLTRINSLDGIERIRFTTSHPKDMSPDLIECFATLDKLCSHIHLPFQSGSDTILKLMNRQYTRSTYIELTRSLRSARPDMAFSADVIVGFPGETETDYRQTIDLIEEVGFDLLYSFKYSPRPGTKAADFKDNVPVEEKKHRLTELQSIQRGITIGKHRSYVGSKKKVLVDGESSRHRDQIFGRTSQNTIVNFPGSPRLIGSFVNVLITRANPNSLTGDMAVQGI